MSNLDTQVFKDLRGNWKAETKTALGDGFVLKVSTHKVSSGALVTTATCCKKDGVFEVHRMYRDFYKTLTSSKVRVTEKAVRTQHNDALKGFVDLRTEALKHNATVSKD